jgi:hypothetical protein
VVSSEDINSVCQFVYGQSQSSPFAHCSPHNPLSHSSQVFFCPKIICVVSRNPFYRAMRRYLRQLYSISLSCIPCPIESFIYTLVSRIPCPVDGGRPFHVLLDAALISAKSKPMAPVVFESPQKRFFPLMDLDFSGPLRCL